MAAIAISSPSSSSLFESPNENTSSRDAKCFMAKLTEVSSPTPSKTPVATHDDSSLSIVDNSASLTHFMANLKGETKMHFENLLKQFLEANLLLEKKEEDERVYAMKFHLLMRLLKRSMDLGFLLKRTLNLMNYL